MAENSGWDDEERQRREGGNREGAAARDYRRLAEEGRLYERRHYGAGDYEQTRGEGYYYERGLRPYEEDRYRYARDDSDRWERPYGAGDYEQRRRSGSFNGRSRGPEDHRRGERAGERRSFLERAGDEVASWFGDRHAEERREEDGAHRGRGPKGYKRSDGRILEDVNDRLTDDAWIDARAVEVNVKDGEVTLSGKVISREDKRRAEDLAERVSGVSHVQNNLRVDASIGETQGDLTARTMIDPTF